MIFVSVGSSTIPFDRLLHAVAALRTTEHVVVQHGASTVRPDNAECVDFLSYDEFRAHVERARVVVSHAGAGSLISAISLGKHPIVVPRTAGAEAVDDHQLPFARRAGELGLVTVVEDLGQLSEAIGNHRAAPPAPVTRSLGPIGRDLRAFIEDAVGRAAAPVASEQTAVLS